MKSLLTLAAAALLTLSATAQLLPPATIQYQARLTQNGLPQSGPVPVVFNLYDQPVGGNLLYTESQTVQANAGLIDVRIGSVTPLPADLFSGHDVLYLGVAVLGDVEAVPRYELSSVPWALRATSAANADDVAGKDITPNSVSINGQPVIDASGNWVGAGGPGGVLVVNGNDAYYDQGNFGIGTSTPDYPLTVEADGYGLVHRAGEVSVGSFVNTEEGFLGTRSNHPLTLFTGNDGSQRAATLTTDGRFGIGVKDPTSRLHVSMPAPGFGIRLENEAHGTQGGVYADSGTIGFGSITETSVGITTGNSGWDLLVAPDGNIGIGTDSPGARLDVKSTGSGNGILYQNVNTGVTGGIRADAGNFGIGSVTGNSFGIFTGNGGYDFTVTTAGNIGIGTVVPQRKLHVVGTARVEVLEITGGADIVESFDSSQDLEPGTVVVIDTERVGELVASRDAYDRKVAGVVSGAGGVSAGVELRQEGVLEGDVKLAMTGRVWVKASAENGAIEAGDLLTTAGLPGHAMRVTDHARAGGAVIGKAMSELDTGTGLVLVLVNLQ